MRLWKSGTYSDLDGNFNLDISTNSSSVLNVTAIGYFRYQSLVDTLNGFPNQVVISLQKSDLQLNQVVVTGNMKQTYTGLLFENPQPPARVKFMILLDVPSVSAHFIICLDLGTSLDTQVISLKGIGFLGVRLRPESESVLFV